MFRGDSLQVLLFFVGMAIGAMIAAVPTAPGRGRNFLWGVAAFFALAAIGWFVAPSASPVFQAIRPIAVAIVQSGALVVVGTVSFVAIMVRRQSPQSQSTGPDLADLAMPPPAPAPKFAADPGKKSKWTADVSFAQAVVYRGREAACSNRYDKVGEIVSVLINALRTGKITAWGKEHPSDTEEWQIRQSFWHSAEVTFETSTAFSNHLNCNAFDVRLSMEELQLVWPPKASLSEKE